MAAVDGVSDDDLRLEAPDDYRNLGAILGRVLNAAVRKSEVLANGNAHYFRGLGGFLRPQFRGAATRHLSGSEIEDPRRASEHVRADQCSAANELHIVGVSGDCQDIDICHAENLLVP